MVIGIIIGRKGSRGFPGKNMHPVCGKPMAQWVLEKAVVGCDEVYMSTDDEQLMRLAEQCGAKVIVRSPELCTKDALSDDVYADAARRINKKVDAWVLMCCNAPTFTVEQIKEGIDILANDPVADSACTVSKYNWYHPFRAHTIEDSGYLGNWFDVENSTCDRNSAGDAWFYDCCLGIVRPHCLENFDDALPPQKWLGKNVRPIENIGGLDVDVEWQMGQVEWWLKNNG